MQLVHKDPCLFSLSTIGLTKRSLSLSNGSNNTIRITLIDYQMSEIASLVGPFENQIGFSR